MPMLPPVIDRPKSRDGLLLFAFSLSGCAALGYEVLWTRTLSLGLGSETLAVLGVLAGFFGGMALGSWVLHDRVIKAANPVLVFVRLELAAAGFALASPWLLHGLADVLATTLGDPGTGPGVAASIAVSGALLLPGSFCLGGTFAALVEARRRHHRGDSDGRGLSRLYAANTLGATLGVLLTVYLLLPALGIGWGAMALAGIGGLAAATAHRWGKAHDTKAEAVASDDDTRLTIDTRGDPDPDVANEPWLLHVLLFGTGLVGVGLEVVGVRILSQVLENTIYTFADILAVYLLGTALGAAVYGRFAARAVAGRPATVVAGLLIALSVSAVLSAIAMGQASAFLTRMAGAGASYSDHLVAEAALAAVVFGLPTVVMGATFAHLTGLVAAKGVGKAYALNTLGAAVAPFVFGIWAISSVGYTDALYIIVYAYLLLFAGFTWVRRFKPAIQIGSILAVVALTSQAPKSLVLVEIDEEWETLAQHETLLGLVVVSEKKDSDPPMRRLQVDKNFRMGGALAFGERRMGHLPLLLAPEAKRALFLGVGTGATAGAVASFPQLTHVDAVELVPAVLEELHHFEAINGKIHEDSRVTLHAADARRFVAASPEQWDVIVADLFHPARDGAGNLYAREHFEHVRDRLTANGLFAQWIPTYQMDAESLRLVIRTFCEVFGEVDSFLGLYNVRNPAIVLIGRDASRTTAPLSVSLESLVERLREPVYRTLLMSDSRDVLGSYLLSRDALIEFAGPGPLSTDLRPRIALSTPAGAYTDDNSRGRTNIAALLEARTPPPPSLVTSADPRTRDAFASDVSRFGEAMSAYLAGERVRADDEDRPDYSRGSPFPAAAVEHYLSAFRTAPDFTAARGMLRAAVGQSRAHADRIYPVMIEVAGNDPGPYQAYLQYLRSIGDQERFNTVLAEAQAKFGQPPATEGGSTTPDPPPMLRP